jgi:hypothetical protein
LANEKGQLMENIWQFSKVYPYVPNVKVPFTVRYPKIVWEWPEEIHVNELYKIGKPLDIDPLIATPNENYWKWREMGMNNPDAVRYPVGRHHVKTCLYALEKKGGISLSYTEARRKIYLETYVDLVSKTEDYAGLWDRLDNGENLLIIETDGPHQESLSYYQKQYDVSNDFLIDGTMLATEDNIRIMLEDTKHPFGHGYCLAAALLGIDKKI